MNNSLENRPDPDIKPASIKHDEGHVKRDRLKILSGIYGGVGKTYYMIHFALSERLKENIHVPGKSGILQYILAAAAVIITSAGCFGFTEYLGYQSISLSCCSLYQSLRHLWV